MEKKEFGKEWQDEQREKMVRIQFPKTIKRIEDRAREEGVFTQWELEYIRELAKEDRLFTRNVVEYNTDTELIKKISNLLKTKEDEE